MLQEKEEEVNTNSNINNKEWNGRSGKEIVE